MGLWWLQPGWVNATCGSCGATIAPEGDPDWGLCWPCMSHRTEMAQRDREEQEHYEFGEPPDEEPQNTPEDTL